VNTFKGHTEKLVRETTHIPNLWQEEFHDHLLRREVSLLKIARYTINNPTGKGFASEQEEYPYCRLIDSYQKKH
jgi:hypothetical protein